MNVDVSVRFLSFFIFDASQLRSHGGFGVRGGVSVLVLEGEASTEGVVLEWGQEVEDHRLGAMEGFD